MNVNRNTCHIQGNHCIAPELHQILYEKTKNNKKGRQAGQTKNVMIKFDFYSSSRPTPMLEFPAHGFTSVGTAEDSIQNCRYLRPRAPKRDVKKLLEHAGKVIILYLPSSGISSCVRTVDTLMCLHTWRSSERQGTCSAKTSNVVTQFSY